MRDALPEAVQQLVKEADAHSEDEYEEVERDGRTVKRFLIIPKEGRSTKVKAFFRLLDKRSERSDKQRKSSHRGR